MRAGMNGNSGKVGNVESVTCRLHYRGDASNNPLRSTQRAGLACARRFQSDASFTEPQYSRSLSRFRTSRHCG